MTVQQLVFHKGLCSSSLGAPETAAWRARLEPGGRPGLSYLEIDGSGVVVRQLSPDLTHVLIGRPEDLGAQLALGLVDWRGWAHLPESADAPESASAPESFDGGRIAALEPLDAGQLAEDAERGLRQVRLRAREIGPGPLEQLVRAVLDDPGTPLTVIAGAMPAAEVLCGLFDLLGPAYFPWTFTTAATGDARILFLDDTAAEPEPSRTRIRLSAEPPEEEFLATYVEAYRRGSLRAVGPVRPPAVFTKPKEIAAWEKDAQAAPGVLKSPYSLLCRAGRGTLTEAEREYATRPKTVDELAGLLPRLTDRDLTAVLHDWAGPEGRDSCPDLADRLTDVAVERIILVPQRSAELAAATAALAPSHESIHRAVETALEEIRDYPEDNQIKRRIGLLRVVAGLGVPQSATDPTIALILSGIAGPTLITMIATSSTDTPRLTELLIGDLRRVRAEGDDAEPVRAAMREHRLLLPVLLRSRTPAEAVPVLRDLISAMFGPDGGTAPTMAHLLGGFPPDRVPAAALAAFAQLAQDPEAVRLLGLTALRQQLAADGIAWMAERSALWSMSSSLVPASPDKSDKSEMSAMAGEPAAAPPADHGVWPLVAGAVLVFLLIVVFAVLTGR
ncbi:hypothetical protein [Actinoplanes sp. NPDC023714]|uniref:hypothetical protein n=1 Tax=Actinoplanes sp. NPDC023714 TaxID=3154322 RepID=UPI0033CE57B9